MVLDGLPTGSVPAHRVTRYGSGRDACPSSADPRGTPIATMRISNDSGGFTRLLTAIAELGPGPRVAVSLEGSRSYGIGLARALTAAGLLIIDREQPVRRQRRGKGKSDPIDALCRAESNRVALDLRLVGRVRQRVSIG
jgi:transposase